MKTFQKIRFVIFTLFCLIPAIVFAQSTILVFGDSLSAGYGIPREAAWPSLLQAELQRSHPQYRVVNASISGETSSGGVRRLPAALKEHKPAIVILELGANDGLRGTKLELTEQSLHELIKLSKASGARVLLLGMQIPPNYGMDYTRRFKALYPKLAKHHQIALVPFMLQSIEIDEFQADNLHPLAEAQPKILQTVLTKLREIL